MNAYKSVTSDILLLIHQFNKLKNDGMEKNDIQDILNIVYGDNKKEEEKEKPSIQGTTISNNKSNIDENKVK
jgi:hypothetical protein